ncbi:unnamed protein product [marine sediment metagenome]|uniref:Uncharacterized protein n=1 Tax=marine sediment metagenome TaxID=412755 RepID=X1L7X7_9ZZZZ
MSSSVSHSIYGDTSFRTVSRFINEIPQDLIIDENRIESESMKRGGAQGRAADKNGYGGDYQYRKGDLIEHKYFGQGKILKVKKLADDCELDVIFGKAGIKHLLVSFAPIKKIK